jgi:hypothetical protein
VRPQRGSTARCSLSFTAATIKHWVEELPLGRRAAMARVHAERGSMPGEIPMAELNGSHSKHALRAKKAPRWQIDAAFLTFAIAVIAVAASIAFAWDATRGKKRPWIWQEVSAISQ